jgi:hypothetical protein
MSLDTPSNPIFRRQPYKPKYRAGLPPSFRPATSIDPSPVVEIPTEHNTNLEAEVDITLSSPPSMSVPTGPRREVIEVNIPSARWRSRDRRSLLLIKKGVWLTRAVGQKADTFKVREGEISDSSEEWIVGRGRK